MSIPGQYGKLLKNWHYTVVTAVLFYLAGRLMFPLTWSQSYAGAVWPPAGIGLGATLLWGYAALPGVYLADLLLHYQLYPIPDTPDKKLIFFLAPLSNVLRSWLGYYLVKRYLGLANPLVSLRSNVLFFVFTGPVAAYVPALLNVWALYHLGIVPKPDLTFTFLTWLLGDCSGIAIFTPLFFIAFNRSHRIWRQRIFPWDYRLLLYLRSLPQVICMPKTGNLSACIGL